MQDQPLPLINQRVAEKVIEILKKEPTQFLSERRRVNKEINFFHQTHKNFPLDLALSIITFLLQNGYDSDKQIDRSTISTARRKGNTKRIDARIRYTWYRA